MFFRRKKNIRKEFDTDFLLLLEQLRENWEQQKEIAQISFENNDEVMYHLRVAEAKYFYIIKEAKKRNISVIRK